MDNEAAFWNACYPKPVAVCGITLKPFSVGHSWHLRSIGYPIGYGEYCSLKHFLLAFWICSRHVDTERATHDKTLNLSFRLVSKILSIFEALFPARLEPERARLAKYISDSFLFAPPVENKDGGLCRTSTCPSMIPMQRALMNHYGYSEFEYLNMPLKKAKWLYYAWLEHERAIEFTTAKDASLREHMDKEETKARLAKWAEEHKFLPRGNKARRK